MTRLTRRFQEVGTRSGLLGAPAAQLAPPPASPPSLERRTAAIERHIPESAAYNGPRTDLPSGWGVRVRIGELGDGTYGVEIFSSTGVRRVL